MKKTIIAATLLLVSFLGINSAQAALTSYMSLGSTGADVTELQTYLATNASIYPQGLVTGYFGELTQAAVERFQTAQGIISQGKPETTGYGRVGPQTMARINALLGSSYQNNNNQVFWDTVPVLSSHYVQTSKNSATISWTTNEPTQGQVYYDTVPLIANEATGPSQQPYVSGAYAVDSGGQTSHSITVQNLQANTTYYYLIRSIDSVGNMSMIWPTSFRTNN